MAGARAAASSMAMLQPAMQPVAKTAESRPTGGANNGTNGNTGNNGIKGNDGNGDKNDPDSVIADLQAQVRMLETDLYSARGRASMMHSKYEAAEKKHEAEVARLKRMKDEELEKQRQWADSTLAVYKNTTTELEFTIQDLKEEAHKRRGRREANSSASHNTAGPVTKPTTPRKSRWNVADGFDDVELLPSPTKGAGRRMRDAGGSSVAFPALDRTPTKAKRRRPNADSPTIPLETLTVDVNAAVPPPAAPQSKEAADAAFIFLQEVLGHNGPLPDDSPPVPPGSELPSTIELFSRYSFPSNRSQTLAAIILERIHQYDSSQGTERLILDFSLLLLGIWSQCFRERYYTPIRALVSLLSHILARDPAALAPHIMSPLLPLAQQTIIIVAGPVFHTPSGSLANHPDYAVRQMTREIDTAAIMSLLRLLALGCFAAPADEAATAGVGQHDRSMPPPSQQGITSYPGLPVPAQVSFWSMIYFEFVLLMLSSKQPPEAFLSMLALLRTSVLPESIGPITNDPARDPSVVAFLLIDRISHHVQEPPKWSVSCKYTEWDVRLSALGLLDCFAQSPFGKLSLAASDYASPRLVGVLSPAFRELQDRDMPGPASPFPAALPEAQIRAYGIGGFDLAEMLRPRPAEARDSGDDCLPLVLLYISSTVYLLHSIVTDPFTTAMANMPAKLAASRYGSKSFYLSTMAKMGFRADPFPAVHLLDDEASRLALELFQLAATPAEDVAYTKWAQQSREPWAWSSDHQISPFEDEDPEQTQDAGVMPIDVDAIMI